MFTDICVIFLEEDVAVTNQAEEDRIVKETKISMDALAVAMVEEEIEYYLNGSKPEILVEGVPTANQADNDGMVEDATEVLVDVSVVANQKGEWLRRKPSTISTTANSSSWWIFWPWPIRLTKTEWSTKFSLGVSSSWR